MDWAGTAWLSNAEGEVLRGKAGRKQTDEPSFGH
jgi:hypothetical protein